MASKLTKSVSQIDNLEAAWRVIQRNGRYSRSDDVRIAIALFGEDPSSKLRSIQNRMGRNKFDFGQAKGAPIQKLDAKGKRTGKIRPLVIAPLESRIVQRAILNVLVEIPSLKPFVNTPYSFGGLRKEKVVANNTNEDKQEAYSAVPAAINAVLYEIGGGATWFASADITAFFTRISKSAVGEIIADCINDTEMIALFEQAIKVELSNLIHLRDLADQFPIEDIGVAQGNSLSPLLGNIILADFDKQMNDGDCSCIRYIDDFIILAPTAQAANARLRKAKLILEKLGMDLSPEKSSKQARPVNDGFEFLGIEIAPGFVRPTRKARTKFMLSLSAALGTSRAAMGALGGEAKIDPKQALIATLKRVDGMIEGWGKHYWFCNDRSFFAAIDVQVRAEIAQYLASYAFVRKNLPKDQRHLPLGLMALSEMIRSPFQYPKTKKMVTASDLAPSS